MKEFLLIMCVLVMLGLLFWFVAGVDHAFEIEEYSQKVSICQGICDGKIQMIGKDGECECQYR